MIILGFWFFIMHRAQQIQGRAGGLFTFGQGKAKFYDVKQSKVMFKGVAGLDDIKRELMESRVFCKSGEIFGD
jgi:cell division protease FtsH